MAEAVEKITKFVLFSLGAIKLAETVVYYIEYFEIVSRWGKWMGL